MEEYITSIGFELETNDMISLLKLNDTKYRELRYHEVIDISDVMTLTNDSSDFIETHNVIYHNDRIKIKITSEDEHTEFHMTFKQIKPSSNIIIEKFKESSEIIQRWFNHASCEYVGERCLYNGVLFCNPNKTISNAKFVTQMTFGVKLENLIQVCDYILRNQMVYFIWQNRMSEIEVFITLCNISSDKLKNWIRIAYYCLEDTNSLMQIDKLCLSFIPRHFFYEFFPHDCVNPSFYEYISYYLHSKFTKYRKIAQLINSCRKLKGINIDYTNTRINDVKQKDMIGKQKLEIKSFKYKFDGENVLIEYRGFYKRTYYHLSEIDELVRL